MYAYDPREFKVRFKYGPGHTEVTVFAGKPGQTKANCGTLKFTPEEGELFREYLAYAARNHFGDQLFLEGEKVE